MNNEQLHGDWLELKTWNRNFLLQMFERVHQLEPDVQLFLNDFRVVNYGVALVDGTDTFEVTNFSNIPTSSL